MSAFPGPSDSERQMAEAQSRVRVYVADDHPLYREGLLRTLAERAEFELVGASADGRKAVADIERLRPDVAVLDARMPELDGMGVIRQIKEQGLPTRVLLLSGYAESDLVYGAIASGATGFLSKEAGRRAICEAVARVARGEVVLAPGLQAGLVSEIRQRAGDDRPNLTPREREVLVLAATGCSAPEMGRRLHLSTTTVKTHLKNLYAKLGVSDRAAAVAEAMRRGLLE